MALCTVRLYADLQRQLTKNVCGHAPDEIMLIPGEPYAVRIAATVNIKRVISTQLQRLRQRHFKHRRHFIFTGAQGRFGGIMPTTGVT